MYSPGIKGISVALFLFISLAVVAKNDFEHSDKYLSINYDWYDLSQDEYFDNRVACEYKMQAHQWTKNLWPKENKNAKPHFSEVVDRDAIYQKVNTDLKMQAVLLDRFNIKITPTMLQHDLDRMAQNTRDVKGLKALYLLFDNNPTTIAECVSRPYLVKKKLENSFGLNTEIHAETRELAKSELEVYLSGHKISNLTIQPHTVTFAIKTEKDDGLRESIKEQNVIELEREEFLNKIKELKQPNLRETRHGYIYQNITSQTESSVEVKILVWPKQSLTAWLIEQSDLFHIRTAFEAKLNLSEMKSKRTDFDEKSVTEERWLQEYYPIDRYSHTAVWTGNEMIVWGGNGGNALNVGGRYNPTTDSWQATSTINAPSRRNDHTAVWTGSEMIVWGGVGYDYDYINSGGRYNPVTDSWQPTQMNNAPLARISHTAIWSGHEMIVWGGHDNDYANILNSGGRYNPSTDSWQTTSTTNAPSELNPHTSIWTGSEMIVWGNYYSRSNDAFLNTGGRYNPVTDSWQPTSTANAPSVTNPLTAVWTGSEMIVWGTYYSRSHGGYINSGGRYNPSTDSWQAIETLNAPSVRGHTAIWTGAEMIVWGGYYGSNNTSLNSGGRYNPATDSWQAITTTNAPSAREYHAAIWTGSEMIIWGGYSSNSTYLNSGGRYNPLTDTWQATATNSAPLTKTHHSAIWTGREMIVWGGYGDGLNNGGRYNPATDNWQYTTKFNAPAGRASHTAIWTGREMIVWGGQYYDDGTIYLDSGGRYDPLTDSWLSISTSNAPTARGGHTAIWSGSEMIVWGGYDGDDLNSGGRYNPDTDSWQATSTINAPSKRDEHTAVWTGSEMIVWGGLNHNDDYSYDYTNSGGRYNPATDSWQVVTSTNAPSARYGHTVIWTGHEMIIWGGTDGNVTDTGGRYHPITDNWQTTPMTNAPSARFSHTAIWSGTEMIVWGGLPHVNLKTGGRYNPITDRWQESTSINAPSDRYLHTAIWTGSEMIIFGGTTEYFLSSYQINTQYLVGVHVNGLLPGNSVILQNNLNDDLTVNHDGSFVFNTLLENRQNYSISIESFPDNPIQFCWVLNGNGIIKARDVENVIVNCFSLDLSYLKSFKFTDLLDVLFKD
ncbi:MAG: Kelch repeat-containing protein [Marinicella pacifica]